MLQEQSKILQRALFFADLILIAAGWILSYYLRFHILTFEPFTPPWVGPLERYTPYLPTIISIWAIVFLASGLYRTDRIQKFYSLVYAVLRAVAIGMAVALGAIFFYRAFSFSRLHMILFGITTSVLMVGLRFLIYRFSRKGALLGKNIRRVLILGAGKTGRRLESALKQYPWMGFEVVGFLDDNPEAGENDILGDLDDTTTILDAFEEKGEPINYVYVALPLRLSDRIEALLDPLSTRLAHVYLVPDLLRFNLLNARVSDLQGLPVLHLIDEGPIDVRRIAKRGMDILGATFALLLFSPVMLTLALLVKLSSRGPVFYRQTRMSLNGYTFEMIKFRSMPVGTESSSGPVWASEGEDRATAIGRFMRKTSLDELPQLFNVLKGDMSLVGPRPERPHFIAEFRSHVPGYMLRHKMKAGMTGWAQVNGWRGNTSIEKRIEYDLYYIQNWSLKLDIKVLFMTFFRGFRHQNAY